jgi:hypothetical protein
MILTRSPFYFNVPLANAFVTRVDFTLIVGTGSTASIAPSQIYEFSKVRPAASTTNLWLDIAPYIRDNYTQGPIATSDFDEAETTATTSVRLASISAQQVSSLGATIEPSAEKYICTDGYGYYMEGQNERPTKKILLTHQKYMADARGYFIVPLRATAEDSDPTVNGTAVDLAFSDSTFGYIRYLVIPVYLYDGIITVAYAGESIQIEIIEECKYPVRECQFVNRYGVNEVMHFYKAATVSISIKSDNFKNNYTNGVSYSTERHQMQRHNVRSNRKVTIETGFLNPHYNDTVAELLQSEKVWLDGVPVNVDTNSLDFKTRIVDKLISYSINFEYAFDQINNV